jgi:glycosyltransferase involved in cell wall biosynthesis
MTLMSDRYREPLLSVIVPVYNVRAFLEDCLSSLCEQDYQDIEIVCIDDGSDDGSIEVLRRFQEADSRIVMEQQQNQGVSCARNRGIEVAQGRYVAFVDGDDCWTPGAARFISEVVERREPDIFVFSGAPEVYTPWIEEVLDAHDGIREGDGCRTLFEERGCIPFLWNKVYRRDFLISEELRFHEGFSLGEDCAFQFLAFPLADRVVFSDHKLYRYRNKRAGSAMEDLARDSTCQQVKNVAIFGYILQLWWERGWLEGREADLLTCVMFLFSGALSLDETTLFRFARDLTPLLRRYFDTFALEKTDRDVRLFYQTVMRVGSARLPWSVQARWARLKYWTYKTVSDMKNVRLSS